MEDKIYILIDDNTKQEVWRTAYKKHADEFKTAYYNLNGHKKTCTIKEEITNGK